jgi:heat shock protein HtpX
MVFNFYEEIRKNKRRTLFIFSLFYLFIIFISIILGISLNVLSNENPFNLNTIVIFSIFGIILATIYTLLFTYFGDNLILKATGAIEASREKYPYLFHTTEALSIAAGLKKPPKCYIIKDSALNAYATGFSDKKSYVVVTTGLLEKLNRQEIEGVLGHEISHIKNNDIKVMLYAAGLVGAILLLADLYYRIFIYSIINNKKENKKNEKYLIILFGIWFIMLILTPLAASMIKFAISREREYLADASAAKLTRYPEGLASALEKIKNDPDPLVDTANKSTAHLFISTPFKEKSFFSKLFSTHPPIEERIKRLRGLK